MGRSLRVNLTDRQLCASSTAEGIGACKGDSGGPLARRRDPDTVSIKIIIISCYSKEESGGPFSRRPDHGTIS